MNRNKLMQILPHWKEIENPDLREAGMQAFLQAVQFGGWTDKTLYDCPISLDRPGAKVNLIEHIDAVTICCILCCDHLSDFPERHNMPFERDIVICGALLHDIGKFVEYQQLENTIVLSEIGRKMKHPLIGALIAAQHGLPADIVQLIALHSAEGNESIHTAESNLVRSIDRLVFYTMVYGIPYEKN